MGTIHQNGGYSAEVRMHLECDGVVYPVAELGPDSMMLRSNKSLPSNGYARLVIEIDEDRTVQDVFVNCIDPTLPELSFV